MNYATWKLSFENSIYGTGPEEKITELGGQAESAWVDGEVQNGAIVIGYVSAPQDEVVLAEWSFTNITEEEALDFCQSINPEAYLQDDGRIVAPYEETRG